MKSSIVRFEYIIHILYSISNFFQKFNNDFFYYFIIRTVVRLGEYNTGTDIDCLTVGDTQDCADPHQDYSVEETIPHSGFSDTNVNRKDDIALVRLSRDAPSTGKYMISAIFSYLLIFT